jgi:hypothetical protein
VRALSRRAASPLSEPASRDFEKNSWPQRGGQAAAAGVEPATAAMPAQRAGYGATAGFPRNPRVLAAIPSPLRRPSQGDINRSSRAFLGGRRRPEKCGFS